MANPRETPTETEPEPARVAPDLMGRPRAVYAVIAIGVLSLLVLLGVIYFSSDRALPEQPICTTVSVSDARRAVLEGRIKRVTLAYDDKVTPPSNVNWGPVLAQLTYTDGQCANLPQGIQHQDDIYTLLGTVQVFNDITEETQIAVKYDHSTTLDRNLFATPTLEPTATIEPTATLPGTPEPTATMPIVGPLQPGASPTPAS